MRNKKITYGPDIGYEYAVTEFKIDHAYVLNFTIESNYKSEVRQFKITVEDAVRRGVIDFNKLEEFLQPFKINRV